MATIRPTLQEITDRIHNDTVARLDSEQLRRSDVTVFERVIAGASHGLYSAIEYSRKQLFPDTAETSYLERLATIYSITRKEAQRATGQVKFEYANGAVDVPVGTLLQDDASIQYQTTTSPTAEGICSIRAVLAGTDSNIAISVDLSLPSPVSGINKAVTYTAIVGGTDTETDDELRLRVLARTQNPPRQGCQSDYVAWALEVDGVGYAWCYPKELGDGTVVVRILDSDGNIPKQTLIDTCKAYIESKASIMATIYVVAPVEQLVNFTLSITPDTIAIRQKAESTIKSVFLDEAIPGGDIYLSHINAAISTVSDEQDHIIVSPTTSAITADNTSSLLRAGTITWQEQ